MQLTDNARAFYKKHVDCYPFISRMPIDGMTRDEYRAVVELLVLDSMSVKVIDNECAYEFHKGIRDFPP